MLLKLVEKNGRNWDKLLDPVLMAYKTTLNASSGKSLFFMSYARDARILPVQSQIVFGVKVWKILFSGMKKIR